MKMKMKTTMKTPPSSTREAPAPTASTPWTTSSTPSTPPTPPTPSTRAAVRRHPAIIQRTSRINAA